MTPVEGLLLLAVPIVAFIILFFIQGICYRDPYDAYSDAIDRARAAEKNKPKSDESWNEPGA
jgi:low affinity Fe/Cu permease